MNVSRRRFLAALLRPLGAAAMLPVLQPGTWHDPQKPLPLNVLTSEVNLLNTKLDNVIKQMNEVRAEVKQHRGIFEWAFQYFGFIKPIPKRNKRDV